VERAGARPHREPSATPATPAPPGGSCRLQIKTTLGEGIRPRHSLGPTSQSSRRFSPGSPSVELAARPPRWGLWQRRWAREAAQCHRGVRSATSALSHPWSAASANQKPGRRGRVSRLRGYETGTLISAMNSTTSRHPTPLGIVHRNGIQMWAAIGTEQTARAMPNATGPR
jgi:hypothetical protein